MTFYEQRSLSSRREFTRTLNEFPGVTWVFRGRANAGSPLTTTMECLFVKPLVRPAERAAAGALRGVVFAAEELVDNLDNNQIFPDFLRHMVRTTVPLPRAPIVQFVLQNGPRPDEHPPRPPFPSPAGALQGRYGARALVEGL